MTTNFIGPGVGLLGLSLLTTLLAPHEGGTRTVALVSWVVGASLLLGVVFVAAHILQELLHGPRD